MRITLKQEVENQIKFQTLCKSELAKVLDCVKNFVGKKIVINTGFSKAFRDVRPKIEGWMSESYGCLYANIKTSYHIPGDCGCVYYEKRIMVGEINDSGVLVKVIDPIQDFFVDYNYTVELEKFEKMVELQEKISQLRRSIKVPIQHYAEIKGLTL
jgi:hypothetical protein